MPPLARADLDHSLAVAERDLRALRGAHLVVTGAAGAVGSWMVESAVYANAALSLNLTISALERTHGSLAHRHPHLAAAPGLRVITGDVRRITLDGAPSHIVHSASAVTPAEHTTAPDDVVDIIEHGTANLLAAAAHAHASRFLQISSGSVYDRSHPHAAPIDESHRTLADGTTVAQRFGAAKRRAEGQVESAATPALIARIFTLVGPRIPLNGQFAIGQFLADALAGRPVHVSGDGTAVRTYMHMADLTAWCWAILTRGVAGRAYNVGASDPHAIGAVAEAVARLPDPRCAVTIGGPGHAEPQTDWYVPDTSRAHTELGCATRIGFDNALARTWHWLVAQ